ncbi:hypothetical protein CPLU01_13714 [Colletotrichum plurivorum]|uniref:Uncharacterized protein n=1 Tax=Colletotrichum plurivorum TaxID=2175906 RepID=A0A8H6JPM2_9PEZI|nr:hypothetical protein CPLU01_13714 [Colletotrichum plurivorum]
MPAVRIPLSKPPPRQLAYRHLEAAASSTSSRILLSKPIRPLHAYRHLLRAATYFPIVCRTFLEDRIRSRFRRERTRAAESESKLKYASDRKAALEEENFRRLKALEEARRHVAGLNAALAGDTARLRRVYRHCFGKLGKKRREMMAAFVKKDPDPPVNTSELQERMDEMGKAPSADDKARKRMEKKMRKTPPNRRAFTRDDPAPWITQKLSPIESNWDLQKVGELIRSQKSQEASIAIGSSWPRSDLPTFQPTALIPKEDQWGRPTAARRITKKVRMWWKLATDKLMPPVDKSEWSLLQSLAIGSAPEALWKMLPRRPVAQPLQNAAPRKEDESFNWAAYATIPIRDVERPRARALARLTGQTDEGPHSQTTKVRVGSPYSNRQLRREFTKIWETTAYIEQVDITGKDGKVRSKRNIVWGSTAAGLPAASGAQHAIFADVNSKGQPIPSR